MKDSAYIAGVGGQPVIKLCSLALTKKRLPESSLGYIFQANHP